MTISNTPVSVQYTGNGTLTIYSFAFEIFYATDLVVYLNSVLQTYNVSYTVAFTADTAGGTITFATAPGNGVVITIDRNVLDARTTDYVQNGDFIADDINFDLDRLTAKDQELSFQAYNRSINIPITDGISLNVTLPIATTRANQYLAFDGSGNAITVAAPGAGQASPTFLPTIAALRALTGTSLGTQIYVQGYYELADGGEGFFAYNPSDTSSSDNGGTIIVDAANHRWYRQTAHAPHSVKWFGAYGDGVHDDTVAINGALTAVSNVTAPTTIVECLAQGGEVYFPVGVYAFSSTLYLNSNVHLVGEDCGQIAQSPLSTTPPIGTAMLLYTNSNLATIAVDATGFWLTQQNAYTGTASAGGTNTITIATGLTIGAGVEITITSGTGSGQARVVGSYISGSGVLTVSWPWTVEPNSTSQYAIAAHSIGSRMTQLISIGEDNIETEGYGSYAQAVAIKNLAIVSLSGHYEGLRFNNVTDGLVENVLISGFQVSLESVASPYSRFENITSSALLTGFGWISGDHIARTSCMDFGVSATATPLTTTNRAWFVDWMANEGLDTEPTYWTAHYFAGTGIGTSINCDGEGGDRSYFVGGPISETFIGCHMERWNQIGFYHNSGGAIWLGGDFFATNTNPAFNGISCNLTIDSLGVDTGEGVNAVTIGSFPNTYGGRVTVRNVVPSAGDSRPAVGSLVVWNAYPPEITASLITTVGAGTLTAADLISGLIIRGGTQSGGFSDATDNATNIVAQFIPVAIVGSSAQLLIVNTTADIQTITAGSGVTLSGNLSSSHFVIAAGASRSFVIIVTDVTPAAYAVTMYG